MKKKGSLVLFCAVATTLLVTSRSSADLTYFFQGLTNNQVVDTNIGEAQLSVVLASAGIGTGAFNGTQNANRVSFTFFNTGPDAASISEIYFDDGSLLGIASVSLATALVSFTQDSVDPVNPHDLPGGGGGVFTVTDAFLADADSPPGGPGGFGVNPGESVTIVFDLQGALTLSDVINDLASGDLRIGIHVISFALLPEETMEGSESFMNVIPAPGAVLLGVIGLGLVGWVKRRVA